LSVDSIVARAQDFDFAPIILKGSIASNNAEHIRFVEEITSLCFPVIVMPSLSALKENLLA